MRAYKRLSSNVKFLSWNASKRRKVMSGDQDEEKRMKRWKLVRRRGGQIYASWWTTKSPDRILLSYLASLTVYHSYVWHLPLFLLLSPFFLHVNEKLIIHRHRHRYRHTWLFLFSLSELLIVDCNSQSVGCECMHLEFSSFIHSTHCTLLCVTKCCVNVRVLKSKSHFYFQFHTTVCNAIKLLLLQHGVND